MSSLFLIAGGGTGAKVAEAFVHLCATGLGPDEAHILFVDSDTQNGNLNRAINTATSYAAVQKWPWQVQTRKGGLMGFGGSTVGLELFRTRVHVYKIAEPLENASANGIQNALPSDSPLHDVLDLLYDADEQATKCEDGFRARPNLGCLLLADHLRARLVSQEGRAFVEALKRAPSASPGHHVPVVVAASVFGGMGASLLPIARGLVEGALKELGTTQLDGYQWGAIKMLPHYLPEHAESSVDPDRFLLDSSSALQFYGKVQRTADRNAAYSGVYVIGSDNPGRNRVKVDLGFKNQSNPPYFEEWLAALAIDHFARTQSQGLPPVRLYMPDENKRVLSWDDLPHPQKDVLLERLAYLLHLGAFFLRQGELGGPQQLTRGIASLLRTVPGEELARYPWYRNIIDPWAKQEDVYRESKTDSDKLQVLRNGLGEQSLNAMQPDAVRYFSRLLMWIETAIHDGADTSMSAASLAFWKPGSDDYSGLYSEMSKLKASDVDAGETPDFKQDNALMRLLRVVLAAMVSDHEKMRVGKTTGSAFNLYTSDKRIEPRFSHSDVKAALDAEGLLGMMQEYRYSA